MKAIYFLIVLFVSTSAFGFTLTLPEPISPPIATGISIEKISIDENRKMLSVEYKFISADGSQIYLPSGRGFNRQWVCADTASDEGTPTSTCFTDVFGFQIRQADVGKKIGAGLWQLIWNKMKLDVLKVSGNDIITP